VVSLQVYDPPATQVPAAPPGPQPWQVWPTCSRFSLQVSPPVPQVPGTVWHPRVALQEGEQHSLPPPTPQVVDEAVQVHGLHVSLVPLQ
jgi:hypothetical protein